MVESLLEMSPLLSSFGVPSGVRWPTCGLDSLVWSSKSVDWSSSSSGRISFLRRSLTAIAMSRMSAGHGQGAVELTKMNNSLKSKQ